MSGAEHCWHTVGYGGMGVGAISVTIGGFNHGWSDSACCWCGAHRTDKHRRVAPPGHGPKFPTYPSYSDSVVEHHYEGGEHPCIPRDSAPDPASPLVGEVTP